jgi:hypothetical protein
MRIDFWQGRRAKKNIIIAYLEVHLQQLRYPTDHAHRLLHRLHESGVFGRHVGVLERLHAHAAIAVHSTAAIAAIPIAVADH